MVNCSYAPGTWLGIVRSRTAVILSPDTPAALVASLWELLGTGPEVHEVLHAVTGGFGVPLTQLPWFGIVDFQESLRVFLRGDLNLTVQLPSGQVKLNGRDVTTWTERWLPTPHWYSLTVPGDVTGGVKLPLADGVVLIQCLKVDMAAATGGPEHGASAETMMGVHDEDAPAPELPGADARPNELTGNYDHLWEKTVIRSIEDAAVRMDPDDVNGQDSEAPESTGVSSGADSGPEDFGVLGQGDAGLEPDPVLPAAAAGRLIDSVPWHAVAPATQDESLPKGQFQPGPAVHRGEDIQPGGPADQDGDHDGQTIMKSDLAGRASGSARAAVPAAGPELDLGGPLVLATVCGHGHANPPTKAHCAGCGMQLPADAVQVPRPRLGRMRLSSGELIDLDQSLVVGRQPSVSRVQGAVMPRLIQVASPSGDISRSHVEVRLEGWHVMLCDLKATNGTVLVREGQQPRRLAQNEMAIILDGDIAEIGDNISLRFEEIL